MATLQKIRNRGGLLVAALGIALLAFVLGDLFNSGGTLFNKFRDRAFSVDGDVVSTGEYQDRITQFEEFQKMMSGQTSMDENLSAQIREYVYEQMVKEKILDDQSAKLGLAVSPEELQDMVYGENVSPLLLQSPMFADPQTRQFSKEGLLQFLSYIHTDINTIPAEQRQQHQMFSSMWLMIERMMKYYRLEEKYNTLVASSISANDIEAKSNIEDTKTNSSIAYVVSRYSLIPDSAVTVSDKEIEKLYNERKNNYKLYTEQAKLSYFVKDVRPSEDDYAEIEKEMQTIRESLATATNPALLVADYSEIPYQDVFVSESSLYPEEKTFVGSAAAGDVYGPERDNDSYRLYKLVAKTVAPDSVKMRMISVPLADEKLAGSVADSLINVINGGKDFSDVANEINPQSNGGDIGWATEAMLATGGEDFVRSCFGASKGALLKLKTGTVTQVVKIDDITSPVSKVKLATIQMSVPVSDKTLSDIDNELNQFTAENVSAADFDKAVAEKGYNVVTGMTLVPSSMNLNQIKGSRQVISWAFNEKAGSVKKFDLPEQRVVAKIDEKIEPGYQPLSEVSVILKDELIKAKKAEKIIADLKTKNATSLDAYAQVLGAKVDTVRFVNFATLSVSGLGREPVVNVSAKHAGLNKLQGPVKGNAGVLVYSVFERQESPVIQELNLVKSNLDRSYVYRVNSGTLFEVLKEKMDVQDNRVKFF
ncbi:peptidylprolyl isomerase [Viscerimonas tarda]